MNTEKFKTAIDVFLDGMREFIPTMLGRRWPRDYVASLQEGNRQKWESAVSGGKEAKELIDFGNLETFSKANFSFWEPFWGDDHEGLLETLKMIRVARNANAHHTSEGTEEGIDQAFEKMILIARKTNQKEMETRLKQLKDAWNTAKVEEKHRMKLVWRKTVPIHNTALFMRISYDEKREDMQKFLQADPPRERLFEGPLAKTIAERVEKYFQSHKLLDNSGQLTPSGKTVAQTGQFEATEEGKYRVWYCLNDELLGNRMLYLERERAGMERESKAQHARLPFLSSESQFWLSGNKDKEGRPFRIRHTGNHALPETLIEDGKEQDRLALRWEWEGVDRAILYLEQGGIRRGKDFVDFRQQELKLSFDLVNWLVMLFPKWNFETKRLPVAFDDKLEEDSKRNFVKNAKLSSQGFTSIEATNIPLMPSSLGEAKKWRNWLVEKVLEKEYVTLEGYAAILNDMNAKTAFSSFQLDSPKSEAFLKLQFEGRGPANRGASFWHLAGSLDLNPNQ